MPSSLMYPTSPVSNQPSAVKLSLLASAPRQLQSPPPPQRTVVVQVLLHDAATADVQDAELAGGQGLACRNVNNAQLANGDGVADCLGLNRR